MERREFDDEVTLDLRQVFSIIRKYIMVILIIPTIAVSIAGISVFFILPPIFRAETTLIVRARASAQTTQVVHADLLASRLLVRTYRELARSRTVAQEVIDMLRLDISMGELSNMIDVTLRGDTEIIAITVENEDPYFAARLANAVAAAFRTNTIRIMDAENVTVIDTATVPELPVRPRKLLTMVVAGFAGVMAGLGSAFVLSYLDNTFKRPEDIEGHLGLPVLGAIPVFKKQDFAAEQAGV
ncbi:MAG: lipopolysaccharide biosynthesis protein [Thermaerobacter sp.]|nr:lipopolysaccharide biosynthesis protein [Thermaerobacter sp.]